MQRCLLQKLDRFFLWSLTAISLPSMHLRVHGLPHYLQMADPQLPGKHYHNYDQHDSQSNSSSEPTNVWGPKVLDAPQSHITDRGITLCTHNADPEAVINAKKAKSLWVSKKALTIEVFFKCKWRKKIIILRMTASSSRLTWLRQQSPANVAISIHWSSKTVRSATNISTTTITAISLSSKLSRR